MVNSEIDELRSSLLDTKRSLRDTLDQNNVLRVQLRRAEHEAVVGARQLEQLLDPRRHSAEQVRRLVSDRGAQLIVQLKQRNENLENELLHSELEVRRLRAQLQEQQRQPKHDVCCTRRLTNNIERIKQRQRQQDNLPGEQKYKEVVTTSCVNRLLEEVAATRRAVADLAQRQNASYQVKVLANKLRRRLTGDKSIRRTGTIKKLERKDKATQCNEVQVGVQSDADDVEEQNDNTYSDEFDDDDDDVKTEFYTD